MPWQHGPDARIRRLERSVLEGDVAAAERLIGSVARQGAWFVPRDYRSSSDWPIGRVVNTKRAYWVRLLRYLRWPGAKELQETVASQAPPRAVSHTFRGQEYLEPPEPMHELGEVGPIRELGPKIAEGIGSSVMRAMAEAAVGTAAHSELDAEAWERDAALARQVQRAGPSIRPLEARELKEALYEAERKYLPAPADQFTLRSLGHAEEPRAEGLAIFHAMEAVWLFLNGVRRHQRDRPSRFADAIFHATYAMAFRCEAERGTGWRPRRGRRPRTRSTDRYGYRPSRACATQANRLVRSVMLPPALLTISLSLVRPD